MIDDNLDDLNLSNDPLLEDKKSGSNNKLLILIAIIVLAGMGGGAYFFLMGKSESTPAAVEESVPTRAQALYVAVEPEFMVNLLDENKRKHYMQIRVTLMTRDKKSFEALKTHMPFIKNDLLTLFASQNYHELLGYEGKIALRKKALSVVRETLDTQSDDSIVEAVLFTKFIME